MDLIIFRDKSFNKILLNIPRYKSFKVCKDFKTEYCTDMDMIFVDFSKEMVQKENKQTFHPLTIMG